MKKALNIKSLALCLMLLFHLTAGAQQRCTECARRAILAEFTNPNNPDYEQKRQEWRDCMTSILGDYVSFSDEDPKIADASEKCSGFKPDYQEYCFPEVFAVYLAERLTKPCFHMLAMHYFDPAVHKQPEYFFKGSYEPDIEGGRIVEAVTDLYKPIIARMSCELYYNGTTPELVQEWHSELTLNSPKGLFNRLNIPKPINHLLYEFEKRPVRCEVKISPPEEICENGTAEIELSGFTDKKGNPSRSFNRIIVSIYKGEILNGENSDFGPDWKVFTVGEGTVKVSYRPPIDKGDGWEWLRVYNSCEILPPEKSPMSGTQIDSLIVDQHFPIYCGFYKGSITVTKSWNYKEENDDYTFTYIGSQTVSFDGIFKPKKGTEEMQDQPIKIYEAANVTSQWNYNEEITCQGTGCSCPGLVTQEYGSGSLPDMTLIGLIIITNSFPTDDKIVADQLAQLGLENWYDIGTPPDEVPTQTRTKDKIDNNCVWRTRETSAYLVGSDIRYKLKDIGHLSGSVEWNSSQGRTTDLSVTNMTEAIYDQKPFDPEKDGNEYRYSIKWDLKAL
ncbi:MAG: hypothetical protein MUC78_12280 [Bacteroidales bacterium]|jgi:hypothetical protein|nr:hypothetical protein [Bacteroidales bacterium]